MDHEAQHAVEVIPGLILGSLRNLEEILFLKPDVIFPLEIAPGWIWKAGYRGEIVYYPIPDYNILPDDVLERLVNELLTRYQAGKRVAVFCVGGHGRTGYVGSCFLHILGTKRPIAFLRDNYSYKAVETLEQENAVKRFQQSHPVEIKRELPED